MATKPAPRPRLGRGLKSLITSTEAGAAPDNEPREERDFFECELDLIDAMDGQPRREFETGALSELARSIEKNGIIQPIVVRRAANDRYEIVAGERRYRAAKMLRLATIPVILRKVEDEQAFALALIENIQRENLTPIEEAQAYAHLIQEQGLTQELLADQVGKNRTTVTNALRLLNLRATVRDYVHGGRLSGGHARALLGLDGELQDELADHVVAEGHSVRKTEALVREYKIYGGPAPADVANEGDAAQSGDSGDVDSDDATDERARPGDQRDANSTNDAATSAPASEKRRAAEPDRELRPQLKAVRNALMHRLGERVEIRQGDDGGGRIEIYFANEQALQSLVDILSGETN